MTHPLVEAAAQLRDAVDALHFSAPVTHVYNPLDYAWAPHRAYLERYGSGKKRVVLLGMNPGPFGMVQTGVPFGEVEMVRRWMGIEAEVSRPRDESPKRPIEGFACARSEVSGRRLWGLFADRFGVADVFFAEHFVANYCPLAFLDGGRNVTPDKLSAAETRPLFEACDAHLRRLVEALEPDWVVGVGAWAQKRAEAVVGDLPLKIGRVLHPSPASPAANRGWAEAATRQFLEQGIWLG
ncbi:uracil-DNA glycosylase family protein [Nitrogeniibacter aestuarii]|uniref:uracil-DNA glycosylase family protein n=1 Tax=Nitrogeniibacter aestuarii TaxID=2815343 RepID=UPI001D12BB92|nr:uracil-DNA glycosylase family protein [Nitrogeniibacter aestuarii]